MSLPPLHLVDATMFWSPTGGGVRRYLEAKHAFLAGRADWRHSIAVPRVDEGFAAADVATPCLPSLPLPGSGGYRLPVDRRAIARALTALAPDLIEVADPYRVAWGARDAAQRLGIPATAFCHSNIAALARLVGGRQLGAKAARWAERYARRVYAGFDLVLAPSNSMVALLEGWGVGRVEHQPLGVDIERFHPRRRDPAWRAAHGFDEATRVLVYAGRLASEKNLDVLVGAVQRLGAPYVLVAIGAGPTPPERAESVVVLPFVAPDDLATALASADAFVHAGDQETFGLSALEAMACGTPAVVRRAGGLAEIVADGAGGIAVEAGTPGAFAEAIEALFAGDRMRIAASARARAETNDWQRVLPELLERAERLVAGRRVEGHDRAMKPAAVDAAPTGASALDGVARSNVDEERRPRSHAAPGATRSDDRGTASAAAQGDERAGNVGAVRDAARGGDVGATRDAARGGDVGATRDAARGGDVGATRDAARGDALVETQAGARADASVATPNDDGPATVADARPAVCIVLHDVAAATAAACLRTLAAIQDVAGDAPVTLLTVPRYHRKPSTRSFEAWLDERVARGDELALHGMTHRDDGAAATRGFDALRRRHYTRGEGEFWALSKDVALARIDYGLAWFAAHGWPLAGFVAPAWLLGPGARAALAERPFDYTATVRELIDLETRARVVSQSVVYSTSSAWRRQASLVWNAAIARLERDNALLRIELHPRDADFAPIRKSWQGILGDALARRQPTTVAEFTRRRRRGQPASIAREP